ncbi:MAG: hypothetical protein A3F11_01290 [Gammaproteobacteria bacterium RIFCSPHIGHO2_12_FULL_37_14]|nr:MAG: hypothetical protein A3F11_01290 [Gammaproteobacteria bacterium RIFCSPHIGHO2_12_FULL_37_14]
MKKIYVFADWVGLEKPLLMGELHVTSSQQNEIFSFEYDSGWLSTQNHVLDPALQLFSGRQYPAQSKENFGIFLDSSPDRWGKFLMNRKEILTARAEKREARKLLASDYLLGVYDKQRLGALRFKTDLNKDFLDSDPNNTTPPFARLNALEQF